MTRELLSLRKYAAHRKAAGLPGGTLFSVQKAIAQGRIRRTCAVHGDDVGACPKGCRAAGIDPLDADASWSANTTPGARRPGAAAVAAGAAPALLEAKISREIWAARNERLKFEERAGTVVRVDRVQGLLFAKGRQVRDALFTLQPRLAPRLAAERDVRVCAQLIDEAVREILDGISWKVEGGE